MPLVLKMSPPLSWPQLGAKSVGAGWGLLPREGRNRVFLLFLTEGSFSYQMLFTGSKNIVPSRSYKILKSGKYG